VPSEGSGSNEHLSIIYGFAAPPQYSRKIGTRSIASTNALQTVQRFASAAADGLPRQERGRFAGTVEHSHSC
jgi:hypothetical protein